MVGRLFPICQGESPFPWVLKPSRDAHLHEHGRDVFQIQSRTRRRNARCVGDETRATLQILARASLLGVRWKLSATRDEADETK